MKHQNKLFLRINFWILIFAFLGYACGSDSENPTPIQSNGNDEITSASGLNLDLTWTPNSGTNPDLDLFLIRGTTIVRSSESDTPDEFVPLQNSDPDGTYTVGILYFIDDDEPATETGNYTLVADGQSGSFTATGSINASNPQIAVITILKDGDTFSITLGGGELPDNPTTIEAENFNITIDENPSQGQSLGTVQSVWRWRLVFFINCRKPCWCFIYK